MEKNSTGLLFSHPDKWKHQPSPVMNMQTTVAFKGVGKNWAGPFFPHPNKIKHQSCEEARLCGWRKTRLARSFPSPTSESINLTLSWICKQPLLFRGWGKTGPAHSFPTLTSVSNNLVQNLGYLSGEKLGWSVFFPPWQMKASALPCHEYTYKLCFFRWWGKTRPAHSFPTPTR